MTRATRASSGSPTGTLSLISAPKCQRTKRSGSSCQTPRRSTSSVYRRRPIAHATALTRGAQNASYATWVARLEAEGIDVVDLTTDFSEARQTAPDPLYLRGDTHWTPEGVALASDRLADHIEALSLDWAGAPISYSTSTLDVTTQGDTLTLLDLPDALANKAAEVVTIRRVQGPDGQLWQPDPAAEVLLLGDSFSNIYSLDALGWGTGAGLAEQLSLRLGRPLDALRLNDAGSYATRQMLAAQRQQGRDRLAGKRLVIYQFASRELAIGDWRTGFPY